MEQSCEKGNLFVDGRQYPRKIIGYELCCAWEGGSTYWATVVDATRPDASKYERGTEKDWYYMYQVAMLEGGSVTFKVDDEEHVLNLDSIKQGIKHLTSDANPSKYHCGQEVNWPKHLTSLQDYDGDACTGDMFLQACLFGEVLFS